MAIEVFIASHRKIAQKNCAHQNRGLMDFSGFRGLDCLDWITWIGAKINHSAILSSHPACGTVTFVD